MGVSPQWPIGEWLMAWLVHSSFHLFFLSVNKLVSWAKDESTCWAFPLLILSFLSFQSVYFFTFLFGSFVRCFFFYLFFSSLFSFLVHQFFSIQNIFSFLFSFLCWCPFLLIIYSFLRLIYSINIRPSHA